jgi:diguanylate cyclase (GGDEF)-like protein/PAS domain S-box-containing protein
MRSMCMRLWPQPALGVATASLAAVLVIATWLLVPTGVALDHGDASTLLLAVVLVAAYILTNHYPIHIRSDMPVCVGSVPALLIACLLPVPQAALAFLVGKGIGELTVRKERGGYYSDVASQAGRWVIVGIAGSVVAHLPSTPGVDFRAPLIAAVAVMWLGDIVTSPLVLYPIIGDHPLKIMRAVAREAGATEGAQYLIGILGVLAAQGARWSVLLLAFPTTLVYLAFKSARDMHETSRNLLVSVVETSPDAILVVDTDRRVLAANRQASAIYGYDRPDDLLGADMLLMVSRDDRDRVRMDIDAVLAGQQLPESEFLADRQNGSTFHGEMVLALVTDRRDRPKAVTCAVRDITRRKQLTRELEHRALHDSLTGLANRTLFEDRLQQAIARAERDGIGFGLLILDLNRFKRANDTLGHLCGDFILQEVGRRLLRVLRESDTVARLGGDEFAVVASRADIGAARIVAQRIQAAIEVPFDFEGVSVSIGTSLGIALYGSDGRDVDTLVRQADAAMYMSKRSGVPWVFAGAQRGLYREPETAIAS